MSRRISLLLFTLSLALVGALAPAGAEAQTICNLSSGRTNDVPGLRMFAGRYRPYSITAPGLEKDQRGYALGPVQYIQVPHEIGGGGEDGMDRVHGNKAGGVMARLALDLRYNNAPDMAEAYRVSPSGSWCTSAGTGTFWFRGSFLFDHRYNYKFNLDMFDAPREYKGVRTTADLLSGWGFPLHRVYVLDQAQAREHAKRLYSQNDRNAVAAFHSYEVVMWGRIYRRDYWGRVITIKGDTIQGPKWSYHSQVQGQIRKRSYMDARIGMPDSAGSYMVVANFSSSGRSWSSNYEADMKAFERMIGKFCGNIWGCGSAPPEGIPAPLGFVRMDGSDEAERQAQACRTAAGGADCLSDDNPYVQDYEATAEELADMENNRGVGTPDTISTAAKTAERTGSRGTAEDSTGTPVEVTVPSHQGRYCLRLLQKDSLNHFYGPREVDANGNPVPPGPWRPTLDQFPPACRASLEEQIRLRSR